jgi:hypothetical protein
MQRSISTIAYDIAKDWSKPYFGAVPYIKAMKNLNLISDKYYHDDGKEIVLRFLCNASTWRGEKARVIKTELKNLAGVK